MASTKSCCICTSVGSVLEDTYGSHNEKTIHHRILKCCERQVCGPCIKMNPRFATYCPYCQPTRLPPLTQMPYRGGGLSSLLTEAPPPYSVLTPLPKHTLPPAPKPRHATLSFLSERPTSPPHPPPTYEASLTPYRREGRPPTPPEEPEEDVTHYLSPEDSFQSISLAYTVPVHILKMHNGIHSDHLLVARRKITIPRSHYQGPSLSPQPLEDPEEQEKKSKIRRLMINCKIAEYKVAVMYLEEAHFDLDQAQNRVKEDDQWEQDHPMTTPSSAANATSATFLRGRIRLEEPWGPTRIARLLS